MSMVMVFHFSNQKGLIYIDSQVENHLEVCLIEDCQEEDHLIETHLEDRHLIYLLDFTNGRHLIQEYSCHRGIHQLQFDLNQPINSHTKNYNIQDT